MKVFYLIASRRLLLAAVVTAISLMIVGMPTTIMVIAAEVVALLVVGFAADVYWSATFFAIDRWRKIGFKLADFPTRGSLAEREALAGLAKEKLSALAWRATALKRERDLYDLSFEKASDAWLDKIGKSKREAVAQAFALYLAAWDLFTKRPSEGGLAILVGSEFRDPETFRHMVSGN